MEAVQSHACPNKGRYDCLGSIEIGSHCYVCTLCRGNKPCTIASPCHLCNAKMLKLQAEVKVNVASGSSSKASSGKKAGSTRPVSKRTRSQTPAMLEDRDDDDHPQNNPDRNVNSDNDSGDQSVIN